MAIYDELLDPDRQSILLQLKPALGLTEKVFGGYVKSLDADFKQKP